MSISRKLFAAAPALAGLLFLHSPAKAQDFGFLNATVAPNPALVGSPIVFSIDITNQFGFSLSPVYVTNAYSRPAVFNSAILLNGVSNILAGEIILTNSTEVVLVINTFIAGDIARLTLNVTPIGAGPFTNQITVYSFTPSTVTTNVVATITPPEADLAVGMTNVTSGVLTNDSTVIGLFVTNLGPNSASGVVVSNALPTSFKLLSVTPSGASNSFSGGNLVLNLGTMASGNSTQFELLVQPTNAGNFQLSASVFTADVLDTNTANNVVTNFLNVIDSLPSDLVVIPVSQQFNRQTGLMEVSVLLTNAGSNVPAARIIVGGLTNGTWLYNAAGTNSGEPYVVYNEALASGASVSLLLEFYVLVRTPFTNYNLSAIGVPPVNLNASTNSGVNVAYTYSSGGFMIDFAATPGKTYTIIYSTNDLFSNALTAQPSIVAPANRVQWIDNGPPKTVSHPSNTTSRFYRVFQSQ